VFNGPLRYVDGDGLKVTFLGSGTNIEALKGAYKLVGSTKRGKQLCEILEKSPKDFKIRADQPQAWFDPKTNTINVDPNFHPEIETAAGKQKATTDVILGHEMGHAATGTKDDGDGNMNNVKQNENPIRKELGYPPRTKY